MPVKSRSPHRDSSARHARQIRSQPPAQRTSPHRPRPVRSAQRRDERSATTVFPARPMLAAGNEVTVARRLLREDQRGMQYRSCRPPRDKSADQVTAPALAPQPPEVLGPFLFGTWAGRLQLSQVRAGQRYRTMNLACPTRPQLVPLAGAVSLGTRGGGRSPLVRKDIWSWCAFIAMAIGPRPNCSAILPAGNLPAIACNFSISSAVQERFNIFPPPPTKSWPEPPRQKNTKGS